MPKLMPIQHSFIAGELSPRMLARSDTEVYHRGLALAENVFPVVQGPIFQRKGTEFFGEVAGNDGIMFGFQRSFYEAYLVVISNDGNLYISDEAGQSVGPELILNHSFDEGLDNWSVDQDLGSVYVENGILNLQSASHPNRGEVSVYQLCTTQNPTDVHYINCQMPEDDGNTIYVYIGVVPGDGSIFTGSGGGTSITGSFTPNTSSFYITILKETGSDTLKKVSMINCRYIVQSSGFTIFPHPWTTDLHLIHAKMPPGSDDMYFTHPDVTPQKLSISPTDVWSFTAVAFTGTPAHWGPKYPRALTFFQGRSWWGGPEETFNASKSSSYEDLTTGSQAADGMEFTISKRGEIVWIKALKNLVFGTRTGEHIVTSDGAIIIPGDINVEQQSAYGSNHCQPVQLGNKAAYVTGDGRRVQDIGYQWTAEQWLSDDLLHNSEHLTSGGSINELIWLQNPNKAINALLDNGTVLSCLYDPNKQIIGWTKHNTNDNRILSMASVEIGGQSYVFYLSSRNSSNMFVENAGSDTYLDASKIEFSAIGKNTIDDGAHLADQTVGVKIDGAVHPDVTLSATGTATLERSGNTIEYGLKYKARIRLMPQDFPTQDGSMMSTKKRWNKIWLRVHQSVIPKVENINYRDRHPSTPMNEPQALISTDIQVSTLGYGDGILEISNEIPLPMRIIGLFGEMSADRVA